MIAHLRGLVGRVFGPFAGWLAAHGVTADMVTFIGALGVIVTALWAFPTGHLTAGALIIALFAFSDALDGTIARRTGTAGPWGAFFDASLDRLSDGALFGAITLYFVWQVDGAWGTVGTLGALAALVIGFEVSYTRARGEASGFFANVGFVERGERLIIALVAAFATGLGLPPAVFAVAMWLIAAGSAVTVVQRISVVHHQAREQRAAADAHSDNSAPAGGAGETA